MLALHVIKLVNVRFFASVVITEESYCLLICTPLATFGASFISKKRFPEDVT